MVLPYALGFLGGGAAVWLAFRTRRPLAPLVPLLLAVGGGDPARRRCSRGRTCWCRAPRSPGWRLLVGVVARGDPAARAPRSGTPGAAGSARWPPACWSSGSWPASSRRWCRPTSLDGRDRTGAARPGRQRRRRRRVRQPARRVPPLHRCRRTGRPTTSSTRRLLRGVRARRATAAAVRHPRHLRRHRLAGRQPHRRRRRGRPVPAHRQRGRRRRARGATSRSASRCARSYTGGWLPLVGQLTGIEFDFPTVGPSARTSATTRPPGGATVVGGLGPGDDYTFTAVAADDPAGRRAPSAYPVDGPLQPAGQALDEYLAPVRQESGRTPLHAGAARWRRYLQKNGRYSDGPAPCDVPPGHDIDRLDRAVHRRAADRRQRRAVRRVHGARRQPAAGAGPGGGRRHDRRTARSGQATSWPGWRCGSRDGSWRILPTSTFMSHRQPKPRRPAPPQLPRGLRQDQQQPDDDPGQTDTDRAGAERRSGRVAAGVGVGRRLGADLAGGRSAWPCLVVWLVPLLKLARRQVRRRTGRGLVPGRRRLARAARHRPRPAVSRCRPGRPATAQAAAIGADPDLAEAGDALVFGVVPPDVRGGRRDWRAVGTERRTLWRRRRGGAGVAPFRPTSLLSRSGSAGCAAGRPGRCGPTPAVAAAGRACRPVVALIASLRCSGSAGGCGTARPIVPEVLRPLPTGQRRHPAGQPRRARRAAPHPSCTPAPT